MPAARRGHRARAVWDRPYQAEQDFNPESGTRRVGPSPSRMDQAPGPRPLPPSGAHSTTIVVKTSASQYLMFSALEGDEPRVVVCWAGPGKKPVGFLPRIFTSKAEAARWCAAQNPAGNLTRPFGCPEGSG
jgi:hypothetical protein